MTNNPITNTGELSALELSKFILSRIVKNEHSIEKMAVELDGNERLVWEIIHFFINTGWITSNRNGTYTITAKYKKVIEQIETGT